MRTTRGSLSLRRRTEVGAAKPRGASDMPIPNGEPSGLRVQANSRRVSDWRRKLGCVAQHRARYALTRIRLRRQQRNFRAANLASYGHDDRRESMGSPTAVAVVVIVMRDSRNWQRSPRGLPRQRASGELVFMNQCPVVRAPHMLREEQMTRSPHVAREREYRERSDDRIAGSPEARLSSGSTSGELHGRLSDIFGSNAVRQSTQMQPDCRIGIISGGSRSIHGRHITNGLRGAEAREIIQP